MKKSLYRYMSKGFLAFVITVLVATSFVGAETIDKIVAVVNDEPITQSELDNLLIPIYEQYRAAYSGNEFMKKIAEARTNLLGQLVEDRLVAQEAERLGVIVAEEEIEAHIADVKTKFASDVEFAQFLEEQQMTITKLRDRYQEQIAVRKLHQYEVRQKVIVSPLAIEDYYNEHLADFTEEEKVKASTIMMKKEIKEEDASVDMGYKRMVKIRKELEGGASFSEYAKQYSQERHASEGGALGFIRKGELISAFDSILFDLPVGALSPILKTELGHHLFFIEAKQGKKVQSLAEVKESIHDILFRIKSKERFEKWMQELKENAYISIK